MDENNNNSNTPNPQNDFDLTLRWKKNSSRCSRIWTVSGQ